MALKINKKLSLKKTKNNKTVKKLSRKNSRVRKSSLKNTIEHEDVAVPPDEAADTENLQVRFTVASDIGKRDYQEDRFIVNQLQTRKELWLFAVFDGHGGSKCSEFCKNELEKILLDELEKKKDIKNIHLEALLKFSLNFLCRIWDERVMGKKYKAVYKSSESRKKFYENFDYEKHTREGNDSGTTATVVLIDTKRKKLVMGNCGDSRSVVLPNKKSSFISTTDHVVPLKLNITNFEVNVSDGRVESDLAMSRSLGDHSKELSGVISREFDMTSIDIKHGARVIMGSDGLFDVFSNADVFVNNETAQQLIDRKKEQIEDNITVIVIDTENT